MRKTRRSKQRGGEIPYQTCTVSKLYYVGDFSNRNARFPTVFTLSPSKYQAFGNVLGYKDTVYEFTVKRPLQLINMRNILRISDEMYKKVDGFINEGDSIEVMLMHPETCLNMSYVESNVKNIQETGREHNRGLMDCLKDA